MADMIFKADLLPETDLGYSLGSSDFKWNIYGNVEGYLPLSGGTMTGGITLVGNQSSAYNDKGLIFTDNSRIGENSSGDLGIYGARKVFIRPSSSSSASSVGIEVNDTAVLPGTNNTESLGSSSKKWLNVYATTFHGDLDGSATSLASLGTIGSSSTNHATALQGWFNTNKATTPRNQLIHFYDASNGNGSATFGYFLSGYNDNPYGGFFSAHYNTPYYVGIQNGTYTESVLLSSTNYTTYTVTKTGSGASGTWGISISGNAATATKLANITLNSTTINNTAGSFAFSGSGEPWAGTDWVGLQIGDGADKFQIHALNGAHFEYRQNDSGGTNTSWGAWQTYVNRAGDTMSGNLTINPSSGVAWTKWVNNTTGVSIEMWSDTTNQGIYSRGYWNGSAYTAGEGWVLYRGTDSYVHSSFRLYGAVWNDYAEYRKDNPIEKEKQKPGKCVHELGDGSLALTTERLMRGCEIISDTFGFAIGQDEENGYNTPIASSGRVLAYPYENIEEFKTHIGYAVCSGPNGTVSIMTDEEEEKYPMRAIGTISEIPDYEEWGTGKVKVNGRIWIRIR